ncbi:MAG: hypothetical protein R2726_14935 [Acidimicrobiales bacterium]
MAECSTTSTPWSSGRVCTGVAVVLSAATRAPQVWASAATAARSVTSPMGFDGVSTHTSWRAPPFASMAVAHSSMSGRSTSVSRSRPWSRSCSNQRRIVQYM